MKATRSKLLNTASKRWIIGLSFLLICVIAFAYVYWKTPASDARTASSSPEQIYYARLVYAANEMHNQVEKYNSLNHKEALPPEQIDKDETYVTSLMAPLTSPPEELSIAQDITEELYRSYHEHLHNLVTASSESNNSYELTKHNYDLFVQNANLITVLSAYSGLDIYCH